MTDATRREQELSAKQEAQPEPNHDDNGSTNGTTPQLETMRQLGQMSPGPEGDSGVHAITIIGQIEGHQVLPAKNKTTKYEHIIPQMIAVEQSPKVKGLLVLLNTVGGDIEAGLAIAEMIRTLSKPTVSLVLGGGHSIGAPIAVAADYSFIADTATITIHPIRLTGLVIGVPQTYEYLDKMQDRVIGFVTKNSRIGPQKFRELMFRSGELMRDIGTVLIGPEAVRVGLCNEVGGVDAAVRKLRELIRRRDEGMPAAPGEGRHTPPPWAEWTPPAGRPAQADPGGGRAPFGPAPGVPPYVGPPGPGYAPRQPGTTPEGPGPSPVAPPFPTVTPPAPSRAPWTGPAPSPAQPQWPGSPAAPSQWPGAPADPSQWPGAPADPSPPATRGGGT